MLKMIGSTVRYGDNISEFPKVVQIHTHKSNPFVRYPDNDALISGIISQNCKFYIHSAFSTTPGHSSFRHLFETQYRLAAGYRASGLVIHIPNKRTIDEIIDAFATVDVRGKNTTVYFEHIPGIYADPKLLKELYTKISKRYPKIKFGICIDTCHIYVSDPGYDLGDINVMTQYLDEISNIGCPILVHLNDSINDRKSGIDRHAAIGTKIWSHDNRESLDLLLSKGWDYIIELDFNLGYVESMNFIN